MHAGLELAAQHLPTADCREVHSPGQGIRAYQQLERQFYNVRTYMHIYVHTYVEVFHIQWNLS